MNSLILIAALTMSTSFTFVNEDRSILTEDQVTYVKEHCQAHNLERLNINYINGGIREIRCYSMIDPEVDINT